MRHPIQGSVHTHFQEVRDAFSENFSLHGEVGASLCVWHQGKQVVDLWGGYRDLNAQDPWKADDLVNLFSVTKGLVATCFLMLVDQGRLDYHEKLEAYWPELIVGPMKDPFASERRNITIADLLNHRSGLLGFRAPLSLETLEDEADLLNRLEQEPLRWLPGSKQGYHGVSFGLYAGALFKKITGQTVGEFLSEYVTRPLKSDLYLGITDQRQKDLGDRLNPIFPSQLSDILTGVLPNAFFRNTNEGRFYRQVLSKKSDAALAFGQPAALGARGLKNFNLSRVRRLELPWANAQGSARGLARMYQGLLGGDLISRESLTHITPRQSWGDPDAVLRKPMGFSYGFVKEQTHLFSPSTESFGHPGAGGALGFADPKHDLVIASVMNQMGYHVRSPRALSLCHAIYRCINKRSAHSLQI